MPLPWFSWARKTESPPPVDTDAMLAATAQHEGWFADDPDDPGGPTCMGVTIKTYQDYYDNPNLSKQDLKGITREEADTILLTVFFLRPKLNLLSGAIADAAFDFSVNCGPTQAIKTLQRTCRAQGRRVAVDGIMGPKTAKAANSLPAAPLRRAYAEARIAFYEALVEKRPELRCFLNGWRRRAQSYMGEDS